MRRQSLSLLCIAIATLIAASPTNASWLTIDCPEAGQTMIYGIDGDELVGTDYEHALFYDGATWKKLKYPGSVRTDAWGIDQGRIVGSYVDTSYVYHAFLYQGGEWTNIDQDGRGDNYATGIDGFNVIGYNPWDSYVHNLQTGVTEILPFIGKAPYGIDGRNIVAANVSSILYDGTSKSSISFPGSDSTVAMGISGNNIVGHYISGTEFHGFLYDGVTWTTLDFPGARLTRPWDIDGDKIVGWYQDSSGTHGFVYTIPEPTTILLIGFGAVPVIMKRKD